MRARSADRLGVAPQSSRRRIDAAIRQDNAGEPRLALATLKPLLNLTEHGQVSSALAARIWYAAAQCWLSLADYAECRRLGDAAFAAARECAAIEVEIATGSLLAQVAYHQGRYADCLAQARGVAALAERHRQWSLAAEAHVPMIMALTSREAFAEAEAACRAGLALAERGDSRLMRAQLCNAAGLFHYYRGLAEFLPRGAARDPTGIAPARLTGGNADFAAATALMERAIAIATELREPRFAAAMNANLQRLRILNGDATSTLAFLRRHLRYTQTKGLVSDEISARHTYAWALRACGHLAEALAQIDAALAMSRKAGRVNRLVEALHYQRSMVLAGLGDDGAALESYRRYARGGARTAPPAPTEDPTRRPLRVLNEPFYLARAEQLLAATGNAVMPMRELAQRCGVSVRALQLAFKRFRGVAPVAHARHLRLDQAHRALGGTAATVAEAARHYGFASVTTFSLEYRRRFGVSPRETLMRARRLKVAVDR